MIIVNRPRIKEINEIQLQNNMSQKVNQALKRYGYFESKSKKLPTRGKIC